MRQLGSSQVELHVLNTTSSAASLDGQPQVAEKPVEAVEEELRSLKAGQVLAANYVWAEMRRDRRAYSIGLFTVFLVIMFVALLHNNVLKAPVVFFRLSEESVGETDLVLTPGQSSGSGQNVALIVSDAGPGGLPVLNHTHLNVSLDAGGREVSAVVTGATSRLLLIAKVQNPATAGNADAPEATVIVLGIDSLQEKFVDIGREWPFGELAADECILSRSVVRQIGMDPATSIGLQVSLVINFLDIASTLNLVTLEPDGSLSAAETKRLVQLFAPGTTDTWDDPITLDVTDAILDGTANANASNVNISVIRDTLREFFNSTLLDDQLDNNNVTDDDLRDALQQLIDDGIVTINGTSLVFNETIGSLATQQLAPLLTNAQIEGDFTLHGTVETPDGKWASSLGSVLVLEQSVVFKLARDGLLDALDAINNTDSALLNLEGVDFGVLGDLGLAQSVIDDLESAANNSGLDAIDTAETRDFVEGMRMQDYVLMSIVQYRDRFAAYFADLEGMDTHMIKFTDTVSEAVGVDYPATFTTPLADALTQTIFIRYFLDNIFGAVVALIIMLGVLLIYSLLLNDVESKTYEYGMLRALGMKQRTLIQILGTKSMAFAVPGIGLGLLFAFLFSIPIEQRIAGFANVATSYSFFVEPIIVAVILGLVMPLASNILPIRRALSRTLRDSLDVYHHVVSDVTVSVQRLANLGVDVWQTALAVLLVVVGFITYYVIPYSFQFKKFGLFLAILNAILLGMLLGLCILAMYLQPSMEKLMLWAMLWGDHKRLGVVIRKNLSGHRTRNRKTAQMFTICLAFIIFAGVMFTLQSRSLTDNVRVFVGADIMVTAPKTDDFLDEDEMSAFLDQEIRRRASGDPTAVVLGYTFITYHIYKNDYVRRAHIANLPRFPEFRNFIYGVQENYLDVTYDQFYIPTETDSDVSYPKTSEGDDDAIKVLFTDRGNAKLPEELNGIRIPDLITSGRFWWLQDTKEEQRAAVESAYRDYVDVIISEALRDYASVDLSTPLNMEIQEYQPQSGFIYYRYYMCKARAMVSKVPGFFFSSYQQTASIAPILIREDSYYRILTSAYKQAGVTPPPKAPKQRLLIKTAPGATQGQREDVINGLRTFFKSDATLALDTNALVTSTKTAVDLLNLFFQVVGLVAMVMCFFILWLSFSANVSENAWEFGVLRAIGLDSTQVTLVYVFEALCVCLASVVLGSAVGILVAISLTLQMQLFLENKFVFLFPHFLFWSMVAASIFVAVLASYLPARNFISKTISNVLRRQ